MSDWYETVAEAWLEEEVPERRGNHVHELAALLREAVLREMAEVSRLRADLATERERCERLRREVLRLRAPRGLGGYLSALHPGDLDGGSDG